MSKSTVYIFIFASVLFGCSSEPSYKDYVAEIQQIQGKQSKSELGYRITLPAHWTLTEKVDYAAKELYGDTLTKSDSPFGIHVAKFKGSSNDLKTEANYYTTPQSMSSNDIQLEVGYTDFYNRPSFMMHRLKSFANGSHDETIAFLLEAPQDSVFYWVGATVRIERDNQRELEPMNRLLGILKTFQFK
ncbi:MAG: hypothetical protein P8P74_17990 [Crocinitomicaceae bacterium]|nr:hypothetical protein [Crocinitomicaceae bacterium]